MLAVEISCGHNWIIFMVKARTQRKIIQLWPKGNEDFAKKAEGMCENSHIFTPDLPSLCWSFDFEEFWPPIATGRTRPIHHSVSLQGANRVGIDLLRGFPWPGKTTLAEWKKEFSFHYFTRRECGKAVDQKNWKKERQNMCGRVMFLAKMW